MAKYAGSGVITRKGQVTIPAEIRRSLGLKEGDRVSFTQDNGHITIEPLGSVVERTAGVFAKYRRVPPLTIAEEKAAFAQAVADEVAESLEREAAMYREES
jgi:AbrB family looped-hinge helix DNA binding protein